MLFYPSGYPKPVRVQGAYVSDKEVSDVVDYLKQFNTSGYDTDVDNKIATASVEKVEEASAEKRASDKDEYFIEAGRFVIEKEKASIGMLQRVYKIGFNRAARIMDQLCEAGVVSGEDGTKPRNILMTHDEFNQYIEECL
jgi:S-DNA-T family DNA segregation ATPase FtsK/SpoIIIE